MSNFAKILGSPMGEPSFSHEVFGERFYTLEIRSERLSGRADMIPCMTAEKHLEALTGGRKVFCGQVRSYNRIINGESRLDLRLFIRGVSEEYADPSLNSVVLTGFICKQPVYRRTPFGREITDMLIAVNRAYHKSDYIPIILWGKNARAAREYRIGDCLGIEGRLQSRDYEKALPDGSKKLRTAYEVSVAEILHREG